MGEQIEAPLVSVLIVTWNRKDDVLETIKSVYDQTYQNFEIIVVDNASTDGTAEAVQKTYPAVRLMKLDQNLGATGGRNAGIVIARGEIIFCLDSDASPKDDTLTHIVNKFQSEPQVGLINSKIVNAYTNQMDGIAGWAYTEKTKANQDKSFLSYAISEGGCAIRKEVFEHIGLFWELLFFGREGEDLSLRAWDARYKVLYWPKAIVYHRASPEKRVSTSDRIYYDLRNSLYIYLVRYPWWLLVFFTPLKIGTSMVKGIKKRCLVKIFGALLDVIQQLPILLKQRHPINNKTARIYLRLQREHGPLSWDLVSWLKYKT